MTFFKVYYFFQLLLWITAAVFTVGHVEDYYETSHSKYFLRKFKTSDVQSCELIFSQKGMILYISYIVLTMLSGTVLFMLMKTVTLLLLFSTIQLSRLKYYIFSWQSAGDVDIKIPVGFCKTTQTSGLYICQLEKLIACLYDPNKQEKTKLILQLLCGNSLFQKHVKIPEVN